MSAAGPIDTSVPLPRHPPGPSTGVTAAAAPEVTVAAGPPRDGALRASHVERESTVAALHRALGEGRLDLDEVESRQAAAYTARYREELPPLLADLPDALAEGPRTRAPGWVDLFEALVWRLRAVVFGPDTARPTPAQRVRAAIAIAAVLVWMVLWAVVGAVVVGA